MNKSPDSLWQSIKTMPWHDMHKQCLLLFLIFVAGWLYHARGSADSFLFQAYTAFESYWEQTWDYLPTTNLKPAEPMKTGVVYQNKRSTPGLILFTETHVMGAKLMDKKGRNVHRWTIGANDLKDCKSCSQITNPRALALLPNGDLIARSMKTQPPGVALWSSWIKPPTSNGSLMPTATTTLLQTPMAPSMHSPTTSQNIPKMPKIP